MSDRYKLVQLGNRDGMFYYKDTQTGARKSLKTKGRKAAEKAVFHMNEVLPIRTQAARSGWPTSP